MSATIGYGRVLRGKGWEKVSFTRGGDYRVDPVKSKSLIKKLDASHMKDKLGYTIPAKNMGHAMHRFNPFKAINPWTNKRVR